jgi:hypothetical protein
MSAPTLYTDGGLVQTAPTLQNRNDTGSEGENLCIASNTYTFTGTEVAGAVIGIIQLPVGCVVKPHLCRIKGNGPAVTATGSLGDSGANSSATQYGSAVAVSSATLDITPTGGAALPKGWDLQADATLGTGMAWITFTLATLSTPTAGKILVFDIVFKQSV